MKIFTYWVVLVCVLFLLQGCGQKGFGKGHDSNGQACLFFLETNSGYWVKDSLGSNGFRSLAAKTIRKMDCKFVGYSKEKINALLGKPNGIFDNPDILVFRYQLTDYGYISHPGQEYMDVSFNETGKVKAVRFWKVDG